jgi:putative PIN family toxin of toxin-antitoxin system
MASAVFDTTVLVSAFLRPQPGGPSFDLLRLAHEGAFELYLSNDILEETARVLLQSARIRRRYAYPDDAVVEYCRALTGLAIVVTKVPTIRVVRDPNDDMILAAALAAKAEYLVTRDDDLRSLGTHKKITILAPKRSSPNSTNAADENLRRKMARHDLASRRTSEYGARFHTRLAGVQGKACRMALDMRG